MLNRELLKKYKILHLIQHGFGGDVWLAEHIGLSGRRVIKCIDRTHPWHDALKNEAKVLQQCRHPSIPIIYDILEFDTQTYIIEEFIEGENLKQYILRRKSLSDSLLLDYSTQICEILQYIHHPSRNILHLDLKPENLLLSDHRMKLVDFGSAICKNQQKGDSVLFGTPGYCAPEQKSAGELTEETDIYSLGKCMEYMMKYTTKVPGGYRKIVENCVRNGTKRYSCVQEVQTELEKLKGTKRTEKPKELWFGVSAVFSAQDSSLFAAALAGYLRKRYRKKVLYLDCTKGDLSECLRNGQSGFVIEKEGVSIAGRVAPEEAAGFGDRGYRYIICDFGTGSLEASNRSFHKRFLVGPMAEWMAGQWKERLTEQKGEDTPMLVLTGGDASFAKKMFPDTTVTEIPLFFQGFGSFRGPDKILGRILRQNK